MQNLDKYRLYWFIEKTETLLLFDGYESKTVNFMQKGKTEVEITAQDDRSQTQYCLKNLGLKNPLLDQIYAIPIH